MKEQVPKKTAAARKRIVEEKQIPITEKNLDRFVGKTWDILVEERAETQNSAGALYLSRLYWQAPEVDGAAIIIPEEGKALRPGTFVRGFVTERTGFDLIVKTLRS
jgi:ribosomal protein S12 methylthiotransferase